MRTLGALVLVLCLNGGAAAESLMLDPGDGIVLPPAEGKRLLHQCSRESPVDFETTWTPSTQQLRELELRLPATLLSAIEKRELPLRQALAKVPASERTLRERRAQVGFRPKDFIRQYAGFVLGGHRVIYVNALPKHVVANPAVPEFLRENWRHTADVVCDGGIGFFGVEYDPATKRFAHFAFNGSI